MRQIILVIVAAFVHIPVWAAQNTPAENKRLTLTVEVINGTANGHPVLGDKVIVTIYRHQELISTLEGEVGTDGRATFENVQPGEHLIAVANVMHKEMKFSGHNVALKPERGQITTRVNVFDVSYDNSSLSVKTHHLIIDQKDGSLLLTEYIQLMNTSDLVISSDEKDSQGRAIILTVPLPKGFKNFSSSSYLMPEALVFTQEGFYDTMAVPPGDHQIIFSYTLDIKSDTMDITKNISLPTANLVLFSQLGREKLQGLGDIDGELVLTNGTLAEYYNLGDLQAGTEVKFKLAGLSASVRNRNSWIILAVVFGTITILAVLRALLVKSQRENHTVNS